MVANCQLRSMQMSSCLLFMLSVAAGLCADAKQTATIPFTLKTGEVKKSADGNESTWDNYLEITGLAGTVMLCPTHLSKRLNDYDDFSGFYPSTLQLGYLDDAKTLILICTETYPQGSGGWIVYGRIVLQMNKKRNGFMELYRNFYMGWVRAGWFGGSYSFEKISYDEGSGFITIVRSRRDVLRDEKKIPLSNLISTFSPAVCQRRVTYTTTFTCQISGDKLLPLSSVSYVNCDAEKYSAADFTEFCREHKITPLDKGSNSFPVVTGFSQPKTIPVETFEQARSIE